jgi:5'-nucleotidase
MTPLIFLTNDDGITSYGLWAAARALAPLGELLVVAPLHQYSGSGRSFPGDSDGKIELRQVAFRNQTWEGYAVGGSPAQVVSYGMLEILPSLQGQNPPRLPDLVVSGINYGENVGSGITASGTVGAALEGADMGIPAMAISFETEKDHHFSNTDKVDFSTAAHFTTLFARIMLEKKLPRDVHVLKIDIPSDATPDTPWEITRMSMQPYFISVPPNRASWDQPARLGYELRVDLENEPEGTDVYTLRVKRQISVTPLSLDLTSRVNLHQLEKDLQSEPTPEIEGQAEL